MSGKKCAWLGALVLGCSAIGYTTPALSQATATQCSATKSIDPDRDGTIDLKEAQKAASALFDRINSDKDGTLDAKELRGRLSKAELQSVDLDQDGTLDRVEFLKVVEQRFKAADANNDGTIDCKELGTAAGKSLMSVLKK